MFEVYGRHAPMFVLSEVRKFADLFTGVLAVDDAGLRKRGVEVLPMSQTVRINEVNQFIVKSALSEESICSLFEKSAKMQGLRDARQDASQLIARVVGSAVEELGVDSCLCMGATPWESAGLLSQATGSSARPLVVFNGLEKLPAMPVRNQEWRGADHPALWIGRDWLPSMEGVEAFFAMSPEFKLEVALNRYQPLVRFGDFAFGMVRF